MNTKKKYNLKPITQIKKFSDGLFENSGLNLLTILSCDITQELYHIWHVSG